MRLFNITNVRGFLERVLRCRGEVYSVGSGGSLRDMKPVARDMLDSGVADHIGEIREISLRLESASDKGILLNFAVQAQ